MTRDKQITVFGQHSYGVFGVDRHRVQVKTPMCFRLGLVFPLHLPVSRLEKRQKHYAKSLPCHISCGDLFAGLADVAVGFKSSHAQYDASAHKDSVAGNFAE